MTQNPDVCLIFSFSFIARREGVAVPVAGLASISRERASHMYNWKEAKTTRSLDTYSNQGVDDANATSNQSIHAWMDAQ